METSSLTLPHAFSTSTYLLISSAKCTINRLHVSLLYLITALSGNAKQRNVRFRKSPSSTGEIQGTGERQKTGTKIQEDKSESCTDGDSEEEKKVVNSL